MPRPRLRLATTSVRPNDIVHENQLRSLERKQGRRLSTLIIHNRSSEKPIGQPGQYSPGTLNIFTQTLRLANPDEIPLNAMTRTPDLAENHPTEVKPLRNKTGRIERRQQRPTRRPVPGMARMRREITSIPRRPSSRLSYSHLCFVPCPYPRRHPSGWIRGSSTRSH